MQVEKFTKALADDLEDAGVKDQPLGVDFIDINMMKTFEQAGITWTDGMTPMMEARAIKSPDEQNCSRIVGSMCDALHYEMSQCLRPGLTENQVAAHGFEFLYSFPGVEDVEDVIVSSGTERVAELAELLRSDHPPGRARDHRRRGADVERLQVLRLPDVLRGREADRRDAAVLRHRAHVAPRLDRRGEAGRVRPATSPRSGRPRWRRGATRTRTRRQRTSGATGSGWRSTTSR